MGQASSTAATSTFRGILFIGSYSPLFAILALRLDERWAQVLTGLLAALGLFAMILLPWSFRKQQPLTRIVKTAVNSTEQVAGYLATYLLPFLATPDDGRTLIAMVLFFVVSFLVYVRSEMIAINPTLVLLGWRVLKVSYTDGAEGLLISRKVRRPGDTISVTDLDTGVAIALKDD
jgi:hypothetical protein